SCDGSRPYLFHQAADDLDSGQVTFVNSPIEGLAGKGLAVEGTVGVAIEEAADLVLQLAYPLDSGRHQRPGELLVRPPFAAFDGVHEMALDRVAGIERNVVTALHHASAAALAEQSFGCNCDVQIGIGFMSV